MRIFKPLSPDHPLVVGERTCALCQLCFFEGERFVLAPVRERQSGENVPLVPLHATCALAGAKTPLGVISRIKDGDASPYPVELEGGGQTTIAEAGYSE